MRKKVTKVLQSGDFESQYGHFYKWLLEFEDGLKASICLRLKHKTSL